VGNASLEFEEVSSGAPRHCHPRGARGAVIPNERRNSTSGTQAQRAWICFARVIFLVTVLLLSTMVVATNILTEGQREKEKEMIWRGNQYAVE